MEKMHPDVRLCRVKNDLKLNKLSIDLNYKSLCYYKL